MTARSSEGGGEPFPTPVKPRHQLPSTHRELCVTPSPAVLHPLLSRAGLCVGLSITGQRGWALLYGRLSFPLSQVNGDTFFLQESPAPKL